MTYTFNGSWIEKGWINQWDRPATVETDQGQFTLPPRHGLVPTLDGPRIVAPGDRIVDRLDGSQRVQKGTTAWLADGFAEVGAAPPE